MAVTSGKGGKGGNKSPSMPTASQLAPILELQAQYNRVGNETPFGSQNYRKNPDGTTTMVTDVGPEGKQLVGRAVGLGMTDSARMNVPPQLEGMAGALASRVGQRMGLQYGNQPLQLGQQAPRPPAKPQQQQLPPTNLPGPQ